LSNSFLNLQLNLYNLHVSFTNLMIDFKKKNCERSWTRDEEEKEKWHFSIIVQPYLSSNAITHIHVPLESFKN
jgi:D-hexose-6-phosphate mutarotase